MKPSGLEVRCAAGYYGPLPSAAEIERARTKAVEAELPPDVIRALPNCRRPTARHTVDSWAGTALDGGRPAVRLAWVPRAAASARDPKAAQVTAVLTRGDARVFEGPVDPAGTIVAVSPGASKSPCLSTMATAR